MADTHPERRRRSDIEVQARIGSLETRMDSAEEWLEGFKLQVTDVRNEVRANTALTEEIHGDTKDIIEAVRWMNTTRKYAVHACGAIVAVAGVAKLFGLL